MYTGANAHFTPAVKTCLSAALTLLCSEDNVPALIVCNLGKDRTGVLSAIVEALCEVPEEAIAHDYSLSKVCLNYKHFAVPRSQTLKSTKFEQIHAVVRY